MKLIFFSLTFAICFTLSAENKLPSMSEEEITIENKLFDKQIEQAKMISSGADIVGNGTGRIELLANYYLRQLDQTISDCLNNKLCNLAKADRFVLKEIRNISLEARQQNKKLIFLDGVDFTNIFQSPNDIEIRIAKTGFNKKYPIFFNLTELFKINEDQLDRTLIAILIHELGHQTGIKSHIYLDEIATRVSFFFDLNFNRIKTEIYNQQFALTTLNNRGEFDFSKSYLGINNQVFEVNYLSSYLTCTDPNLVLVGINLTNEHFKKINFRDLEINLIIGFWANLYCEHPVTKEISSELKALYIEFNFEKNSSPLGSTEFILKNHHLTILEI